MLSLLIISQVVLFSLILYFNFDEIKDKFYSLKLKCIKQIKYNFGTLIKFEKVVFSNTTYSNVYASNSIISNSKLIYSNGPSNMSLEEFIKRKVDEELFTLRKEFNETKIKHSMKIYDLERRKGE